MFVGILVCVCSVCECVWMYLGVWMCLGVWLSVVVFVGVCEWGFVGARGCVAVLVCVFVFLDVFGFVCKGVGTVNILFNYRTQKGKMDVIW